MANSEIGYPFERDLMQFEASKETSSGNLDYKRVLFRAIKYWYILVVSLLICLAVAYLINRYTTRVYSINASIIIKESEENVEGKLLYNNLLVDPYRNFKNELHII